MKDFVIYERFQENGSVRSNCIGEGFKSLNAAAIAVFAEVAKRIHSGDSDAVQFEIVICQDADELLTVKVDRIEELKY